MLMLKFKLLQKLTLTQIFIDKIDKDQLRFF